MQIPKKNAIKLLMTLFMVGFEVSCATPPPRPAVELCLLDVPASEVICGVTRGSSIKTSADFTYENLKSEILASPTAERLPMLYVDRAIAERPDEFAKQSKYIKALEQYIDEHTCQPK